MVRVVGVHILCTAALVQKSQDGSNAFPTWNNWSGTLVTGRSPDWHHATRHHAIARGCLYKKCRSFCGCLERISSVNARSASCYVTIGRRFSFGQKWRHRGHSDVFVGRESFDFRSLTSSVSSATTWASADSVPFSPFGVRRYGVGAKRGVCGRRMGGEAEQSQSQ